MIVAVIETHWTRQGSTKKGEDAYRTVGHLLESDGMESVGVQGTRKRGTAGALGPGKRPHWTNGGAALSAPPVLAATKADFFSGTGPASEIVGSEPGLASLQMCLGLGPKRRDDAEEEAEDRCGWRSDADDGLATGGGGGNGIAALVSAFLAVRLDRRGMSPSFSSNEPPGRPTLPPHSTAAAELEWLGWWLGWWFSATPAAAAGDADPVAASPIMSRWGGVAYNDSVVDDDFGGGEGEVDIAALAAASADEDTDDDDRRSRALMRMASRDLGSKPFTSLFSSGLEDAEGDDDGGGGGGGDARGWVVEESVTAIRGCSTFSLRARAASKPVFSGRFGSSCDDRFIPLNIAGDGT